MFLPLTCTNRSYRSSLIFLNCERASSSKCKPGFIGHDCQTVVDECGGTTGTSPSCYNGSKCQKNGTCNCDELNRSGSSTDAKYAGVMCENISTSFCASSLIGNHAPNHQFCTNHGICKSLVMDGEPHPGCNCKDGYSGDHCELIMDPFSRPLPTMGSNNGGSTNSIGAIILFSALIVAITGAIVGGALLLIRKRRSNNDDNRVVLDHIQMNGREKAVGVEALEADGSGTLGIPSNGNGVSAIDEDGKRQFSIGSIASDDEDDAERSSSEPEIV